MNKEKFWQTIESVNRLVPDGDHEMVQEQMHKELLRYSPQDILDWNLILREYENAAYRNDLWAACTALGAHASDDGFDYFRTWLISQGKDIYMEAMRDPDTLASNPHSGKEMSFEAFAYCAIEAYKEKLHLTGKDSYTKPFDDLDKHKLSDELVQDIINEIPQHPDMSGIDLPLDYSAQFPHIWERMKAHAPETSPAESGSNSIFSMRRIFKINDLFGRQISLQPHVELYSVRDFMGQEMPGLAIVLDMVDNQLDIQEQYAVLTVSFGEFISAKNCAYIDTNNCAILHNSFWFKGLRKILDCQEIVAFANIHSGTSKKIFSGKLAVLPMRSIAAGTANICNLRVSAKWRTKMKKF